MENKVKKQKKPEKNHIVTVGKKRMLRIGSPRLSQKGRESVVTAPRQKGLQRKQAQQLQQGKREDTDVSTMTGKNTQRPIGSS